MKLALTSVANSEDLTRERIVLRAGEDLDLNYFAVFCCHIGMETVKTGDFVRGYWFTPKQIKTDDLVVLYTKSGSLREKVTIGGRTSHFFYWGRSTPLWTPEHRAVVVHTAAWQYAEVQPTED